MKKLLFYLSVMGLVGCGTYTVKNDWTEEVRAGQTAVAAGGCEELSDNFFGLFGDYPIKITTKDGEAIADNDKEKDYEAAHWVVKTDGTIEKATEACQKESAEDSAAEGSEADSAAEGPEADSAAEGSEAEGSEAEGSATEGSTAEGSEEEAGSA